MATSGGGSSGNAGTIRAGKAVVEASLDDAGLKAGLQKAKQHVLNFSKQTAGLGAGLAAGGALVEAPIAAMFSEAVSRITDVRKAADQLGTSTEVVSTLGFAAKKVGVDFDGLVGAGRKVQRTIAEAAGGNLAASKAFEQLGLNAEDLLKLPLDEQFGAIADGLAGISNPAEQADAAFKVLGKAGVQLLPILRKGSAGLRDLKKEATDIGAVVSTEDAAKAKIYTKAIGQAKDAVHFFFEAIGTAVLGQADQVKEYSDRFVVIVRRAREWVEQNRSVVTTIAAVAAGAIAAGTAIVTLGAVTASTTAIVSTCAAVMDALLAPELLIVAAFVAAGAAGAVLGYQLSKLINEAHTLERWAELATLFGEAWSEGAKIFGQAWEGIGIALKNGDLKGAFDILFTSLKLAWAELMRFFEDQWLGFKQRLKERIKDSGLPGSSSIANQINTSKDGYLAADDAVRQLQSDLDDLIRKQKQTLALAVAQKLAFAGLAAITGQSKSGPTPSQVNQIARNIGSVASAQQYGGSLSGQSLGLGSQVRKSDETKELEKMNRKLLDIDEHIQESALRYD